MNVRVQYFSKSGNTRKLADAMAEVVGTKAESITEVTVVNENIDVLFLGGSIYAGHIDFRLKEYIASLNNHVKRVAIFSTSAGKNSAYKEMQQLLETKHITVLPEEYYCKGKFLMAHRKHPDENDLEMGKKFALSVMRKVESNI